MRRLFLLVMVYGTIQGNPLGAQVDAHFTQYYASPLWLNPAFTGVIDGNYRLTANYRYQWPSITSPFTTKGVSADMALAHRFGIGMTILNLTTGDGGYHYTSGYLSLAYSARMSAYQFLSAGFQLGLLNRRIDPSKFQFGNQYNPVIGYDPSLPSNEIFNRPSASSFDGSLGIVYFDGNPARTFNPFIGASLYHFTEPNNQFLSNANDNKVPVRYSLHGGARIKLGSNMDMIPHVLYLHQGNASETAGGVAFNIRLEEGKDLIAGGTYRLNDAVAPNLGLHLNGLTIGFSYDINTSKFKTASSGNGGYELSISFTGRKKIPETRFICPRL